MTQTAIVEAEKATEFWLAYCDIVKSVCLLRGGLVEFTLEIGELPGQLTLEEGSVRLLPEPEARDPSPPPLPPLPGGRGAGGEERGDSCRHRQPSPSPLPDPRAGTPSRAPMIDRHPLTVGTGSPGVADGTSCASTEHATLALLLGGSWNVGGASDGAPSAFKDRS